MSSLSMRSTMGQTYEVWDTETGSVVGEFPTVETALDVVRSLLEAVGPAYSEALVLLYRDASGAVSATGSGNALVRLSKAQSARHVWVRAHLGFGRPVA